MQMCMNLLFINNIGSREEEIDLVGGSCERETCFGNNSIVDLYEDVNLVVVYTSAGCILEVAIDGDALANRFDVGALKLNRERFHDGDRALGILVIVVVMMVVVMIVTIVSMGMAMIVFFVILELNLHTT